MSKKELFTKLLADADIVLDGSRLFDITINDERVFSRVLADGSLGFGESYMDGWWDSGALDETIARILGAELQTKIKPEITLLWNLLLAKISNRQSRSRAFLVGEAHYDIGNDLYQAMLDSRLTYTCGYWKNSQTLEQAQEAKLDLVCKKVGLKPGMRVLDIGCGWGSFMKYAAEKYGVSCVGVTVSKNQKEYGEKMCAGLPIEFRLQDYRELNEPFDAVISLGMFEHVGYKNYRTYMKTVQRCTKDGGLFLLHTIGGNHSATATDTWIEKYVFPNSLIPSAKQISSAAEDLFIIEDWHNFGADYDKTLMAWFSNFNAHWPTLKEKYGERFYRMWKFYLLACAATFRVRHNNLWQIVFSKSGVPGGYTSIR